MPIKLAEDVAVITTLSGREVAVRRVGPEIYWRTGGPMIFIEDRETGEVRTTLKARLRATGGKEEMEAALSKAAGTVRQPGVLPEAVQGEVAPKYS